MKRTLILATAVIGIGVLAGSWGYAQEQPAKPQQPGMMGMMHGVDPAQMRRMVENCNRMMESMMQGQPAPEPEKKG